jgi:tRNA A37 methylthiotransferase MiaB
MLTQQEVAFARAASMAGQTVKVLIDRAADKSAPGDFVGRTTAQAPDIDSVTYVRGRGLHAGQMLDVRITESRGYDFVATVPAATARSLKVVSAAR